MLLCTDFLPKEHFERFQGFIFDCDGVLIDSREANAGFYNIFRAHYGLPFLTEEEKDYVHGAAVDDSLDYILPPEARRDAETFRKTLDYRDVLPVLKLEPGLRNLLLVLKEQQVRMGINTNRTTTMNMLLSHFGLTSFFNPVVQARNVSRAKPHPEGVNYILSAWNLPREAVVFIGDSGFDQAAAKGAGVTFWAYKNPSLTADLHLPDFQALTRCIRKCRTCG